MVIFMIIFHSEKDKNKNSEEKKPSSRYSKSRYKCGSVTRFPSTMSKNMRYVNTIKKTV